MTKQTFESVLVANRGEIAQRILRGAREQGYRTIAVYSEADRDSPHVACADEAVLLGPAPARDSYLNPERVLEAAARSGAQAIHPGYGFLSENAAFATACHAAGLVFIGPSSEAIRLMGNKAAAKRRMLAAGVPCIPGYQDEGQSDADLLSAAAEIGMPLMVKAAAGGGGRGMRLVQEEAELLPAIAAARSEAESAFASGELILEKALLQPRHVEIQVFGDAHGQLVHMGERDCSIQRRHQKVVEEAPCPVMTPELREAMGEAAVAAAKSIDYVGAGTVEFLLDAAGSFYFLEMNTRLQVEHPVTECVTGIDLVALQFAIAQGGHLPWPQEEICIEGHAIEVRLYAEDSSKDFLPASGDVHAWLPPEGCGVRVDHGLVAGQSVSPFYDPMLAKIVAFGSDRAAARRRLLRALRDTVVFGVVTNRQFLIDVLERERFVEGAATTAFVTEEFPQGYREAAATEEHYCLAGLLQFLQADEASRENRVADDIKDIPLMNSAPFASSFAYRGVDGLREIRASQRGEDCYRLELDGKSYDIEVIEQVQDGRLRVDIDGHQGKLAFAFTDPDTVELLWHGQSIRLRNELAFSAVEQSATTSGAVIAPMHGNVLTVSVAPGQRVQIGDELAVMEAMKMEHRLTAAIDGEVTALHVAAGEQVASGQLLLELEAGTAAESAP